MANTSANTASAAVNADDPIEIQALETAAPWWPYSVHSTYRLVRQGELRAIVVGRRRFVTVALLREFLARHTSTVATGASAGA